MSAVWSPRWARAPCLRKLQVVSPRRYAGTHHGYESNWYPPLSPLPLRSHKIQRSGSGRRNQWNTGDGRSRSGILGATERSEALSARVNTARPAGRDSKREAEPIRFAPRMSSGVSSRADHLKLPQTPARAQRGAQTASIRRSPAPRFCPNLPPGRIWAPSGFFFHRARRILFRQDEKEWGAHPCP